MNVIKLQQICCKAQCLNTPGIYEREIEERSKEDGTKYTF